MALQSSGAISLANVQTEFGGSNPIGINEYYGVAAGVPGSGTISLADFYGKSAGFAWTQHIFGYRDSFSINSTSDTFPGNIVTPGSAASPKTFEVWLQPYSPYGPSGYNSLSYYQGGSLNTTWAGNYASTTTHTFTFGSSSMQFSSYISDTDSYDNTYGYNLIYWTTPQGAPQGVNTLFYHVHSFGGGGFLD